MLRRNFLSSIPFFSLLPFGFKEKENPENLPVLKFDGEELINADELFKRSMRVSNFDEYKLYHYGELDITEDCLSFLKRRYDSGANDHRFLYCFSDKIFALHNFNKIKIYTGKVIVAFPDSSLTYVIRPCQYTKPFDTYCYRSFRNQS